MSTLTLRPALFAASQTETGTVQSDARTFGGDVKAKDKVQTDKGFKLREFLEEKFGAIHDRPEDISQGMGKHGEDAASAAENAQARGHSERLVKFYQSFKMLKGRPIQRDEWPLVDYMLSFIGGVQIFSGPLKMY